MQSLNAPSSILEIVLGMSTSTRDSVPAKACAPIVDTIKEDIESGTETVAMYQRYFLIFTE